MDEVDFLGQTRFDLGERLISEVFRTADGCIDAAHHILEEGDFTLLGCDDGLPVPLVDIERVEVVQFLVGAYSVHVGIDAVARFDVVLGQRETLPFGQRVHHLGLGVTQVLDGECHGSLHSVEVVVDAETFQHKQRRRDTRQPQFGG